MAIQTGKSKIDTRIQLLLNETKRTWQIDRFVAVEDDDFYSFLSNCWQSDFTSKIGNQRICWNFYGWQYNCLLLLDRNVYKRPLNRAIYRTIKDIHKLFILFYTKGGVIVCWNWMQIDAQTIDPFPFCLPQLSAATAGLANVIWSFNRLIFALSFFDRKLPKQSLWLPLS